MRRYYQARSMIIVCHGCKKEFDLAVHAQRIKRGKRDLKCPYCFFKLGEFNS